MARVFLDTNVFLFGYPDRFSNSYIILRSMEDEDWTPVISYRVLEEVQERTKRLYGKEAAGKMRITILTLSCLEVVGRDLTEELRPVYEPKMRDKDDVPHVCAYIASGCDWFVTNNRKLMREDVGEVVRFIGPREFVENVLGWPPSDTPY